MRTSCAQFKIIEKMHVPVKKSEKMSGIKRLNTFTKENHIVIDDMELENPGDGNGEKVAAVITLRLPTKNTHIDLLERISAIEGVNYVEEI